MSENTSALLAETRRRCEDNAVHAQVELSGPEGSVKVDEGMAPLLEELWARGIGTLFSCQGGGERDAYVTFDGPESATQFMRLAVAAGEPAAEAYVGPGLGNWASTGDEEQTARRRAARKERRWRTSAGVVPFKETYQDACKVTVRFSPESLERIITSLHDGVEVSSSPETERAVEGARAYWWEIIERDRAEISRRLAAHDRIGVEIDTGQLLRVAR